MKLVWVLEFTKILLPTCVGAMFAYLLLRRVEEIKSEIARHSDFSCKWAELFFDASNTFMVSVERLMALYKFLSDAANPNDQRGIEQQCQANDLLPALFENRFRIQRLTAFAPTKGAAADMAAGKILESIAALTQTRKGNLLDLRQEINAFNHAAREAHSEMLSLSKGTPKRSSK